MGESCRARLRVLFGSAPILHPGNAQRLIDLVADSLSKEDSGTRRTLACTGCSSRSLGPGHGGFVPSGIEGKGGTSFMAGRLSPLRSREEAKPTASE